MKTVLASKRKYNWRDFIRAIVIFIAHFLLFLCWTLLFIYLHDLKENISFNINIKNWWIFYPLTLGPFLSTFLHIFYAESGKTNLRALLWLHSLLIIIGLPIVSLLFK